uniref:Protein spaetzle n=1 Tax=Dendroctonus ponderosae TaxID=77166 RepID=A0AAR5QJB3_DENPD
MYILLLLAGAFVVPLRAEESNSDQLKELLGLIQNAGPEQNILENINLPENVFLNISQYLEKYGYPLETHQVETEDGFTLILHRIPASESISKNNPAVLFAPPLMSSSIDWVNHGSNYSLGLLLSDLDYDIWLLNPRGTRYSMTHNTLNSTQKKFWSYSFHEKGYYDTAVSIDYVLNLTGQQKVTVVGYSEGTSALLALAAARPEYNEKINLIVLLSPIGYMGGVTSPIALFQVKYMTEIKALLEAVNFHAIPYAKWVSELLVAICSIDGSGETCAAALGPLVGYDTEEVDLDYLLIFISDKPSGLALQELYHYGQEILSDSFQQYDYGVVENLLHYGTPEPPTYNVSQITAPVAAYYAKNDFLASIEDVEKLLGELPNIADEYLVESEKFSHLDFFLGKHTRNVLYERVLSVIQKYNPVCLSNAQAMYWVLVLLGALIAPLNSYKTEDFNAQEFIASLKSTTSEILDLLDVPEDAFLNISQYLEKHGYPFESHHVLTDDGYIVTLHRIPAITSGFGENIDRVNPAVLFVPPMLCSSIDWVSRGANESLGLLLSDLDYDVWLLNTRGTRYSMLHQNLNITGKEFWNFSFHEKGYFDVAASIDYILNSTGLQKITAIGYSEGTSALLALTSTRTEYLEKLNLISLLSPIGYMGGVTSPIPVLAVSFLNALEIFQTLPDLLKLYGIPHEELLSELLVSVCVVADFEEVCLQTLGLLIGFDSDEIALDYLLTLISDKPSGISFKQLFHYGQEMRADAFQQFDYGSKNNMAFYGSSKPPAYNVSAINVPVAVYYAKNDFFAALEEDLVGSEHGNSSVAAEYGNRTEPRILTHPPKGELYGREQDIVFPDSIADRSDILSRLPPPKCADGLGFCEDIEGYPYRHIKKILQERPVLKSLFGQDEAPPEIANRLGDEDEKFVCRSLKKTIFPKMAETKSNKWKFVINQGDEDGFVQGIQVEICKNPDGACDIPGSPSIDSSYTMACRQKYVYRRLFTLDNKGEPVSDSFKMPSACCCAYKQNFDFLSRHGKTVSTTSKSSEEAEGE